MTGTNRKSDRTETRHSEKNIVQEGKRESLRDEIFEIVKEIVSGGREREWERAGGRVGVHCKQQIVGAHVVEVAQVPGALLFHGSHSLSVKTAQPCRQLCSGGCGGERRERREERTFVFHFAPHLHQCPHFFSPGLLCTHSTQNLRPLPCLFYSSEKLPQKKQRARLAFDSLFV